MKNDNDNTTTAAEQPTDDRKPFMFGHANEPASEDAEHGFGDVNDPSIGGALADANEQIPDDVPEQSR